MSTFNTLVAGTAGVIGWLVVSYLLDRAKSKRQDLPPEEQHERQPDEPLRTPQIARDQPVPAPVSAPAPGPAAVPARDVPGARGPVSLDEIGRTWHIILGVSSEARADEIERAYYAKLAECDRARLAPDATFDARRNEEQQRALLTQAFEFIRPLRS